MLHNRLSQLFQKQTDRILKDFLNDNPDLLKKYVDGSVAVVGAVLGPINVFMRHLLTVQGLDPDSVPGEKERALVQEALHNFFSRDHGKDFDEDYDFSWVHKKFEEARGHMKQLTKEKFVEMTDLSKLPNIGPGRYPTADEEQEIYVARPSTVLPSKEIRITGEDKKESKFDPGDAIKQLQILAEEMKIVEPKKSGLKTGKKKLNKSSGPGVKVRRISPTPAEVKNNPPKRSALKKNLKARFDASKKLVDDMVACGLVENNDDAKKEQLEQLLLMDEGTMASLSRVVAKHAKPVTNNFTGSFRRVQK